MSETLDTFRVPRQRKRALSDVFRDKNGRPFHGEHWRKSVYQSLDPNGKEIRVLCLYPSRYLDSDIVCQLVPYNLEADDIGFDAISYVWGDQSEKKFICLNGFNIKIGVNAYNALRNTRHPQDLRLVWIDSLCINQADIVERNYQIQLMKDIYSQASQVLFCVCEPSRYATTAARMLEEASIHFRDVSSLSRNHVQTPSVKAAMQRIEETLDEDWKSISQFLEEAFWQRLWIVQEVTLGSARARAVVLIGRSCIDYASIWKGVAYLALVSKTIMSTSSQRATALNGCLTFVARSMVSSKADRYSSMYISQVHLQVSDDKDRIYGLLALFPELASQPSYQNTTEQVYEDATAAIIDTSGSLQCMAYREYTGEDKSTLASWATDFRRCVDPALWNWAGHFRAHYSAAGVANLKPPLMRNGNRVCVLGMKVSQLENAAALGLPNLYKSEEQHEWLSHMESISKFAIRLICDRDNSTNVSPRQVFETGRALFLDVFREEPRSNRIAQFLRMNAPEDFQHFEDDPKPFWETWIHLLRRSADHFLKSFSSHDECFHFGVVAYFRFTRDMLDNTRIAMDSSGHLCVVPVATQVGDVIYLLAGSSLPLVLRPVADARRPLFKVVGPGYVHGIMDGELVYDSPKRVSTGDPDAYDAAFDDIWLC